MKLCALLGAMMVRADWASSETLTLSGELHAPALNSSIHLESLSDHELAKLFDHATIPHAVPEGVLRGTAVRMQSSNILAEGLNLLYEGDIIYPACPDGSAIGDLMVKGHPVARARWYLNPRSGSGRKQGQFPVPGLVADFTNPMATCASHGGEIRNIFPLSEVVDVVSQNIAPKKKPNA